MESIGGQARARVRVFSKVRSGIVRLMGNTNGQVTDDKAAGVSQWANIMPGGPMWRNEHEMRACKLLGWDASKGLLCNAIYTTYRTGTADCAQLLFDDNDHYRSYGTDSFSLDKTCALDYAVRNHIGASSDDPYSHPTDFAVVIVPGMRDDTKCTFLLVPDFMVRRTLVMDTWCLTTCCFMIYMCSYVQVRPHAQPAEYFRQLVILVKKFPEAFFMHATAFFNAALRGAFALLLPARLML